MEKRLKEISDRLVDFSYGRFERRISISGKKDLLDGISNAINMLGEELNETVITKNYFNSIFNSVSDMVFILGKNNIIVDLNETAIQKLQLPRKEVLGKRITFFLKDYTFNKSSKFTKKSLFGAYPGMRINSGKYIPVRITFSKFQESSNNQLKIVTATDISLEILQQNVHLRAIIDAQESERQRIAIDLHDTIIQQVSAIKFQIGGILNSVENKSIQANLQKSNQVLSSVIKEVRNICFNIMPSLLKEFGLIKAIREFALIFDSHTKLKIVEDIQLPPLSEQLKIDLYRALQELLSNAIKHGKATLITLRFYDGKNSLKISFSDNGKGFNPRNMKQGMGLQNIRSRIESHHGYFLMESSEGNGCSSLISIPITQFVWPA